MRRLITTAISMFAVFANAAQTGVPMPPMPPEVIHPSKRAPEPNMNKEGDPCKAVPPMIIFLPPPLAKARAECLLKRQKPSMEEAKRLFAQKLKSDVDITSIKGIEGFDNLYRFDIIIGKMRTRLFCDAQLQQCIQGERVW